MSFVAATLRRSLWLLLIGAVGGVAWSWWSDRNAPPSPTTPPEWPPIDGQAAAASDPTSAPASAQPTPDDSSTTSTTSTAGQPASNGASSPSVVNALIDAPEARSSSDAGGWTAPADDGSCPMSHPVKANDNSGIFHVPGGRFYDRTNPERCYTTPDTATADGYRQAKN
jgi:hypothetical protein